MIIATSAPCRAMRVPRKLLGFALGDDGVQRVCSLYCCQSQTHCPHHPPVVRLAARGGACDIDFAAIEFEWDAVLGWWRQGPGIVPRGTEYCLADYLLEASRLVR